MIALPMTGSFFKRHVLWLGLGAALVPLLVLLGLQYWWLTDLQQSSAIARQATLDNFLEAVATHIEFFYKKSAERHLNLPSLIFTENKIHKAAYLFRNKWPEGVRSVFIHSFLPGSGHGTYFLDCQQGMVQDAPLPIWRAVKVASAPWKIKALNEETVATVTLSVDEMDPENRIVLNPITDESSRLVGLAGMVIDSEFFEKSLLPQLVEETLPKFFTRNDYENLVVTVRDGRGRLVMSTGETAGRGDEVTRAIPFVFTDWRLGLQSRFATPEQWARTNFALNVTLSVLLAAALLGGIVFALRVASREIHLSQMKADFVSNVSHELRTPLSSIRVFGEFLGLGRVRNTGKIREYGEYIEAESRRLTQLIDNILDFSKIESGQKIYKFARGDVATLIDETIRTFEVRLKHDGFHIRVERGPGSMTARIDPDAIAQAFHNLLDNAVKYSGDSREIAVRLGREDGWVVVEVEDRGVGISESEQAKIFERFHRVGTTLVHDVKGSGLGLAIVSHVVKAHGGKVEVRSTPGHGSTFKLSLPVDGGTAASAPRAELQAAANPGSE